MAAAIWTEFGRAVLADHLRNWDGERRKAVDLALDGQLEAVLADVPAAADFRMHLLDEPHLLSVLSKQLGLTQPETEILAVMMSCETDPTCALLSGWCQGGVEPALPSLGLLGSVWGDATGGQVPLGPGSRLGAARLVRHLPGVPWQSGTVGLEEAVLWTLVGDIAPDPELPPGAAVESGLMFSAEPGPLWTVSGADSQSRLDKIRDLAAGGELLVTPPPEDLRQWSALIREATLRKAVPVLTADDGRLPADTRTQVRSARYLQWAVSSPHRIPLQDLPRVRSRGWHLQTVREPFGDETHQTLLTPIQAKLLRLRGTPAAAPSSDELVYLRPSASTIGADRLIPRFDLDDVVLSDPQRSLLAGVSLDRRLESTVTEEWGFARTRTLVLLQGPPGTGKTATAEALAGSLRQELLTVNVAALVSKYIGETQKNFEQLFTALEDAPAVLLIDEVDALFGKRTSVNSSNDRYANLETSYLLQRLERLTGVVVMTTNLTANIDPAFARRFDVIISFELPKEAQRQQLWMRSIPARCPGRDGIDFAALAAEFDMSGAMIDSAARRCAFDSARAGEPVTTEGLRRAASEQMRKHGWLDSRPV